MGGEPGADANAVGQNSAWALAREPPMNALALAPFTDDCLLELRRTMRVAYESWTDTRRLYDPYELAERVNAECASVLVVESDFVFEETLALTPGLRFIGVCRASVNHIDVDSATARGIAVVNAPGRNANAVAEHALALMLALARGVPKAHRYVQGGQWQNPAGAYLEFQGVELCGRALGAIGLGAIGRRLAAICGALGMSVQAYDPYVNAPPQGVALVSLEDLLRSSDFVSAHLPLTDETAGILDLRLLRLMRRDAYLVSVADAGVFAPNALADALRAGLIAGAAVDVFESHPISPQNPLLKADNAILSPHIGGATAETIQRHSRMMTDDILRFMRGDMPHNLVNKAVWERRG